jgi:hypothetical protein
MIFFQSLQAITHQGPSMLYLDLPTTADITDLAAQRNDLSVSIFLPTTPVSLETDADRILLKNLTKEAFDQLQAAGADQRRVNPLIEEVEDLIEDDEFWRFQAHGLAIYATPDNLRTFRVPNALESSVKVSDRFHLKPLLRAINFGNACYVLALADGGVRLIEVSADLPAEAVKVEGLPTDAASSVGQASIATRSYSGRIGGSEGKKVRLRQYARQVDAALRGLLAGQTLPLILASVENLGAIYRSINTYPHLATPGIEGNPERSVSSGAGRRRPSYPGRDLSDPDRRLARTLPTARQRGPGDHRPRAGGAGGDLRRGPEPAGGHGSSRERHGG